MCANHYHDSTFQDATVKRHRLRVHKKSGPLVAEICETNQLQSKKDTEKLYQKIITVITLLSGLGSPTVPSVLKYLSHFRKTIQQTLN